LLIAKAHARLASKIPAVNPFDMPIEVTFICAGGGIAGAVEMIDAARQRIDIAREKPRVLIFPVNVTSD